MWSNKHKSPLGDEAHAACIQFNESVKALDLVPEAFNVQRAALAALPLTPIVCIESLLPSLVFVRRGPHRLCSKPSSSRCGAP